MVLGRGLHLHRIGHFKCTDERHGAPTVVRRRDGGDVFSFDLRRLLGRWGVYWDAPRRPLIVSPSLGRAGWIRSEMIVRRSSALCIRVGRRVLPRVHTSLRRASQLPYVVHSVISPGVMLLLSPQELPFRQKPSLRASLPASSAPAPEIIICAPDPVPVTCHTNEIRPPWLRGRSRVRPENQNLFQSLEPTKPKYNHT